MDKKKFVDRTEQIYGNCEVYSPKGNLMFLCLEKRAKWYLERNLAKRIYPLKGRFKFIDFLLYSVGIKKDDVLRIKLKFEPKNEGNKNDSYSLSRKENKCVVTGETELKDLTKHHIVPHCYRKHMPEKYKVANSHDVVPITKDKHHEYEGFADILKHELSEKYDAPIHGITTRASEAVIARKNAFALHKNGDKIPGEKKEKLIDSIKKYLNKHDVTSEDIQELAEQKCWDTQLIESHGKIVIDKIMAEEGEDGLQKFVEMWRQDFLDNMNPQYMPKHWDVKRPAKRLN